MWCRSVSVFGMKVCRLLVGCSVGGDSVVGSGDRRGVWRGMYGAYMCDMFPTIEGGTTSLSFTINPPSTNSQIVCHRKDRGGCGCAGGRGASDFACLMPDPHEVTVCSLFLLFRCCFLFVWWC